MGADATTDVYLLVGTALEGRFVVERAIAEGGFGLVYRAQQAALDRPVALKVLKTPRDLGVEAQEQFLEAFANEAKTIARITHPNIVQVYDFGVSTMPSGARAGWMALEWLTGRTLEEDLAARDGRGRGPLECLEIMRPVMAALATVHAAGVAHRDLKPANIMLVPTPTGSLPKLLDFGIAKIMGDEEEAGTGYTATRSRQIAFSPAYASPEQISHGRSGPWTDVHALGLTLTEMLVGQAALTGKTTTALFQQILDRARPSPARFGFDVGKWEAVLTQALAVTPGDRYKDAGALLDALERTSNDAASAYLLGAMAYAPTIERPSETLALESAPTSISAPSITRAPLSTTLRAPSTSGQRARWIVAGSIGLASIVAIGGAVASRRMAAPPPAASGPAPRGDAPEPADVPIPASHAEPPSTGSVATPSVPPTLLSPPPSTRQDSPARSSAARPPRMTIPRAATVPSATAATPHTPKTPTVNCDPPFTVDPHGAKHYKPECDN